MVKKTGSDELTKEIKKALKEENVIIGTEITLKNLKQGKIARIYLSSNCQSATKDEISHLAEINKTKIIELGINDEELGVICKKPFSISVLSVSKQ